MGHPQPDLKLPPFDELVELAQRDPNAFNQLKHDMCEQMICSASHIMQDRLRAQQSHIDLVVSRCKNPHQTNVVLMRELRCQVCKFQEALQGNNSNSEPPQATIIVFKPRNTD
ncbi:DUF3135 domain-containing protein [Vibrio fortis]|uniref:DUF3135 domain-containing protein n=1 Tax=Vibrio fortis TaxID=212667 RepID=A0A5N3R8V0_9VIBR|nr:DUF3135 domain-containing protein [Vibrio fortis]KAB0290838.1 DUF3135 domain-containing protein [Vibrio fortis]